LRGHGGGVIGLGGGKEGLGGGNEGGGKIEGRAEGDGWGGGVECEGREQRRRSSGNGLLSPVSTQAKGGG